MACYKIKNQAKYPAHERAIRIRNDTILSSIKKCCLNLFKNIYPKFRKEYLNTKTYMGFLFIH